MAEDIGFLDRIKVGAQDERAILAAKRDEAYKGIAAQHRAAGQQASPFVHGLLNAFGGLMTKKGREAGIKENLMSGMQGREDFQTAQAAGIDVDTLKRRRAMREALNKAQIPNDGSFKSRMALANVAAQEALNIGDAEVFAAASAERMKIRREEEEFRKLKHGNDKDEFDYLDDTVRDFYLRGDGTPRSGQFDKGLDPVSGREVPGMHSTDEAGNYKFYPLGTYSETDPTKGDETFEPLDARIRKKIPKAEGALIRNLVVNNETAMDKFERVTANLIDITNRGDAEAVFGASGQFISFFDNLILNIKGVAESFFGPGEIADNTETYQVNNKGEATGVRTWMKENTANYESNKSLWDSINLPAQFRNNSAEAQRHRGQIMELAYMAARLSEPSNRGLSDNDIKNALRRLGGDSANPQVMLGRFVEIMADGASELKVRMSTFHNSFQKEDGTYYTDDEVDEAIAGKSVQNYYTRLDNFFQRNNIVMDAFGRPKFSNMLSKDRNPGPGTFNNTTSVPVEIEDDDTFLDSLINPPQ